MIAENPAIASGGPNHRPPPPVLPGFEHVRRNWNNSLSTYAARILPGEYYVTRSDEGVSTTLGSCISACIRDRVSGIGGMNHFMLPASAGANPDDWKASGLGAATRYGNFAMEHLINEIMRNGGRRENLEVKVFGGGRIMEKMTDVGQRNIVFVRDYLSAEGLKVVAEDVGDIYPRMIIYFPATGVAKVKRLRSLHNNLIVSQEKSYVDRIAAKPVAGDVELF
jgi:chemotaxis protein CheD